MTVDGHSSSMSRQYSQKAGRGPSGPPRTPGQEEGPALGLPPRPGRPISTPATATRNNARAQQEKVQAATRLQAVRRGSVARKGSVARRGSIARAQQEKDQAATRLQAARRGSVARRGSQATAAAAAPQEVPQQAPSQVLLQLPHPWEHLVGENDCWFEVAPTR